MELEEERTREWRKRGAQELVENKDKEGEEEDEGRERE